MAESFAVFDEVQDVLDRHLTATRWTGEDEYEQGIARRARAFLEELIETRILVRHDNDPRAVAAEFDDLRDSIFWSWLVDASMNRCSCQCEQHG
ncbi:hypothetical protein [uncultured Nocardioides sp.]|uniref:hypothetical protein n=1 Tax=uncultured Nocardioides sp. TaxID=198441 RepID=UPI002604068A|nr:hypothetical protein [uncultured Nocardioides sp.]